MGVSPGASEAMEAAIAAEERSRFQQASERARRDLLRANEEMILNGPRVRRGFTIAPAQGEVDHSLDALRYITPHEAMPRPNLHGILDMYCDVLVRHVKKRDGFKKSATHPGTEVASLYLTMAETVGRANSVTLGDPALPSDDPVIHSIRCRLVSASIKVGTPRGIVKELWYEEQ